MNVTGCVPLGGPGRGLIARYGGLVGLTDGADAGPDPLLSALAEVASANGDGTALALAVTRAALERGGRPAWACAGPTSGGEVTVLVHGEATALVSVAGSQEAEVTAADSMIPVVRTFAGAFATVRLFIGAPAAPDPRVWLGAGVISAGGVLLTVAQEANHALPPAAPPAPAVAAAPALPAAPAVSVPPRLGQPANQPGYEPTMLAGVSSRPDPAAANGAGPAAANHAGPAARGGPDPHIENWFSAETQPAGPTMRMTRTDQGNGGPGLTGAGPNGMGADRSEPPPIADLSAMELVRLGPTEPVLVDGTLCDQMHFNPPGATFCRECGIGIKQPAQNMRRQPRPPLGLLLVDDGRGYVLDRDFVIGREPLLDGDVAAGRATPLPISDPEGSVSRLHLRVSLVGWQVEAHDLGSSNGSVLYRADGPRPLPPLDAAVLEPGVRVGVGRRTVQFLPYSPSLRRAPNGAI